MDLKVYIHISKMQLAQKNLKGNYVNNWEKKINMPKTVKNKLCNCKWFVVHFSTF